MTLKTIKVDKRYGRKATKPVTHIFKHPAFVCDCGSVWVCARRLTAFAMASQKAEKGCRDKREGGGAARRGAAWHVCFLSPSPLSCIVFYSEINAATTTTHFIFAKLYTAGLAKKLPPPRIAENKRPQIAIQANCSFCSACDEGFVH